MSETYELNRKHMVENQIRNRGVKDKRVIDALLKIPRDLFVPEADKIHSHHDGPLSIGYGQTISQPYIVAYMTELLELEGDERVLEIGTGSGYQTAILAEIVKQVFTIEVIKHLANSAEKLLINQLGYSNIHFKIDNGREGWTQYAPFDRIIITAASHVFPEALFFQLTENGIAVAPVGNFFQQLVQYKKKDGQIREKTLIGVSFVPLI